MIRRLFRFALKLGVVGSVVAVAVKALDRRRSASSASDWSAGTEPWPPIDLSDRQAPAAGEPEPAGVVEDVPVEDIVVEEAVVADIVVEDVPVEDIVVEEAVVADILVEDVESNAIDGGDQAQVWSDPHDDGSCPVTHPVKAKLASGVFHLPGMANYERTKADRCYPDADAAQADDLRQAKR